MKNAILVAIVAVCMGVLPAAPALAGDDVDIVIEVVVKVAPGDHDVGEIAARNGGYVVDAMIESRGVYVLGSVVAVDAKDLEKKSDDAAKSWAKDLEKEDDVAWAEPVWIEEPEDTRFHAWPDSDYTPAALLDNADVFASLHLDEAHEVATGMGVVVAVLDTGVDTSHPLLAGSLLPGYDLVEDDDDPTDEIDGIDNDDDGLADEAYGHGTFVSGVLLQVAPDATILPIRVLDADGRAEVPTVVEGIYLAIEQGADIINLSFGLPSNEKPDSFQDALKAAKESDVIVVVAAGNHGDDEKRYPASGSSVISVGAIDGTHEDDVVTFSSHGKWVVVAAPGVGIVSAVPGGTYATWAGTSVAAPIVAGQAALLVDVDPDAAQKDVEKALKDSARKMGGKNKTEKGVIDILESLAEMD